MGLETKEGTEEIPLPRVKKEEVEETLFPGENDDDNEEDLFSQAHQYRETFEYDGEGDEEHEDDPEGEEIDDNVKVSDTTEEDETYYKLAMGFLDTTRAMGLSMYAEGDVSAVDKYIFYKDWNDPKHKAELEAGRVVARKWKFSAFKHLPEMVLILAVVVSTVILFNQAKKDKKANEGQQAPKGTEDHKKGKEVPLKHRKLSKVP